jgi:hypothetical protein
MGTVYVIHGVVDHPEPDSFLDRNMLDGGAFDRYLAQRPFRFTTLEQALAGEGDALTIDDSISAGAAAALLARRHGHEVTLFLNSSNIQAGSPYWFSLLNLALDRTRLRTFGLGKRIFALDCLAEKQQFRRAVKRVVCRLPDEDNQVAYVRGLTADLGVPEESVPVPLRPLTPGDVSQLVGAGVRVENHGWTHTHPLGMQPRGLWADVKRGQSWLEEKTGVRIRLYAVPFGESLPPEEPPPGLFDTWFLADARLFPGPIGRRIVNRKVLSPLDVVV